MTIHWLDPQDLDQSISSNVVKTEVVLDIGCGIRPQAFFRPRLHICCEPHEEYVRILQNRFAACPHVLVIQSRWQDLVSLLPDRSVDTAFLIDVIEHLDKEEGHALLQSCERIARQQIVVFTPLGFMPQEPEGEVDGWGLAGAHWQWHKSGWMPADFDSSWTILAAEGYHRTTAAGRPLEQAFGAFWAIKTIASGNTTAQGKFALVSPTLPPSMSAQAVVLHRILAELPAEQYCLISQHNYDPLNFTQKASTRLPTRYHKLPTRQTVSRDRFSMATHGTRLIEGALSIARRAQVMATIVKRERCTAIVACSGDSMTLPAALLASRLAGVPLHVYMLGLQPSSWANAPLKSLARLVEGMIVKGASTVLTSNEALADYYERRYRVKSVLVRNPCDGSALASEPQTPWPSDSGCVNVVCTGETFLDDDERFDSLLTAIELLQHRGFRFHVYGPRASHLRMRCKTTEFIVHHSEISPSLILDAQRKADVLFLPLSFRSSRQAASRTFAPIEMGEYLAAGRPILVHAPADTFVAGYFRERNCGVVVDQDSPELVRTALVRIAENAELRCMISTNARNAAMSEFDPRSSRRRLLEAVASVPRRNPLSECSHAPVDLSMDL